MNINIVLLIEWIASKVNEDDTIKDVLVDLSCFIKKHEHYTHEYLSSAYSDDLNALYHFLEGGCYSADTREFARSSRTKVLSIITKFITKLENGFVKESHED
jgi:hypothetical protein